MEDIFNLSADDVIKDQKKDYSDNNLYRPDVKKTKNNTYNSLIKFLPYAADIKNSTLKKYTNWITDPVSGKSRIIDCPSSIEEKSIIQDTYFKLKDSTNASERKLQDKFKRKVNFFSPVLIIKDPQNPELEGKILIYQYGIKIYNKIKNILKPSQEQLDLGVIPNNPFDIFEGKSFKLTIKIEDGYPNYDDSQFMNTTTPLVIDGVEMTNSASDKKKIIPFLKDNTPDIEKYRFTPWDDNTRQFVKSAIMNIIPNSPILEEIFKNVNTSKPSTSKKPNLDAFNTPNNDPNKFDDEDDDIPSIDPDSTMGDSDDFDDDFDTELDEDDDEDLYSDL